MERGAEDDKVKHTVRTSTLRSASFLPLKPVRQLFSHAKISILLTRMREIILGANALLTDVLLTDTALTDASLTVTLRPNDELL
jgi:hypothetical protein